MNTFQKISIVVPVYNGERTLQQCLSSLIQQTYPHYEIIIIDNGSTDNTKKIIEHFKQQADNIKYFFEQKVGRGSARNRGIKEAAGEIIAMIDSDCIAPEEWLEKITKPIRNNEEKVVMGFQKDLINNYWTKRIQQKDLEFIDRTVKDGYASHLDTKNFAITSEIAKSLGFNAELKALEDWDFFLRLKNSTKIKFIPQIIVEHYHDANMKSLFKTHFERAYYAQKIIKLHQSSISLENDELAESTTLKRTLLFIPWILVQLIKQPKNFLFLLVSDGSWRLGVLYNTIKGCRQT